MGSRLYRNDISNDNAHSQYASLNLFPCYTRHEPRILLFYLRQNFDVLKTIGRLYVC